MTGPSFEGASPQPFRCGGWALPPHYPLPPAGLEPAGLDWGSRSAPAASPHVIPMLGLGSWEESCVSSSVSM